MNKPECKYGYPWDQIEREWSDPFVSNLRDMMSGSTMALCPDHGVVVYTEDFNRFISVCQAVIEQNED